MLADALNAALPQTQCTRCGYPDCRAYAEAIAGGEAAINRCPPGGAQGIERLAGITGRPALPLDPVHGQEGPRRLAVIDEAWCIGCTLCLQACPVDCIVGAPKQMHTIIPELCTGCELCLPVCPVDCIALVAATGDRTGWQAWSPEQAAVSRQRYDIHRARLQPGIDEPLEGHSSADDGARPAAEGDARSGVRDTLSDRREAIVAAALARARASRPRP